MSEFKKLSPNAKLDLIGEAVRRVQAGESQRSVVIALGVPRTTIQDRLAGRQSLERTGRYNRLMRF